MTFNLNNYLEKFLIPEIVFNLDNEQLIDFKAENSYDLDGFMSNMYSIILKTKTSNGIKERSLMAKFMRGDALFRDTSKSYIQFANEIYVYDTILPQYDELLKELKISNINIMDLVPHVYIAKFGYIEGFSSSPNEMVASLVMGNLKPLGYQLASSKTLDRNHLLAMCKPLAQYHALSYAIKVLKKSKFESLIAGIKPLPFISDDNPNDANNYIYRILHRCGFDRFYDFYDRYIETDIFDKNSAKDLKLMKCLDTMRKKYFAVPSQLPQRLINKINQNEDDKEFAVILHGDYYRNNVLFKYNQEKDYEQNLVCHVKMFDFQQLRFGSPAFDLSFFMYLNTTEKVRNEIWLELLKCYHENMFSTLKDILHVSTKSKQEIVNILSQYSFERFQAHFARFAFFGVMICLHFLPWMLCSDEECSRFSELFALDVYGKEFHKLSVEAGGDAVNLQILSVLRHACEMGYMDDL